MIRTSPLKTVLISTVLLSLLIGLKAFQREPQHPHETSNTAHKESKYPFMKYCEYFHYPVEEHFVTTADGYILRMFRIQKKHTEIQKIGLEPILLQHGLLDSSDTWIVNDQDKAPAFMLANRNYDIWLGNNRGNKHSRNHTQLNPDKNASFWEWSFQHMADFDLPAMLEYVSNVTLKEKITWAQQQKNRKLNSEGVLRQSLSKQDLLSLEENHKVNYIGHSQGSIQMHIALSKRNSVVEKVLGKYFAFGPVAFVKYAKSNVLTLLDKSPIIEFYNIRKIHEFMPSFGWFTTDIGIVFCSTFPKVCGDIMTQIMDADPSVDNYERYDVLVGHAPAGTSVQNMKHWKQLYDQGKFQAYDYGSARENQKHYNGSVYPPTYNLNQIRKPMRLIAGSSDELADLMDVEFLWNSLQKEFQQFYKVYNAGHCTFMWGVSTITWMNDVFSMLNDTKTEEYLS